MTGDERACPRCAAPRDSAAGRYFDAETGSPLDPEHPPSLRCWHCGQAIEQRDWLCPHCGTALTPRHSAAIRYDVVPRSAPPPHASNADQNSRTPGTLLATPPDLTPVADAPPGKDDLVSPPRRRNYFVRHWRGELPLAASFWVNILLLNVVLTFGITLMATGWGPIFNPYWALSVLLGVLLLRLALQVWQVVGVWRSAQRRMRDLKATRRSRVWAGLAQGWALLFALSAIPNVAQEWPYIADGFEMVRGDPDIPDFTVTTLADGSAVIIQGGFKYGMAAALDRALRESPEAGVVYLDSDGGRVSTAIQVYDIIRSRGLDTYVIGACQSACPLAFVAGADRTLGAFGLLGFHAPYIPGVPQYEVDQSADHLLSRYRRSGVSAEFVRDTLRVSPETMWYPTPSELQQAGVITRPPESSARPPGMPFDAFATIMEDRLNAALPSQAAPGVWLLALAMSNSTVTYVFEIDTEVAPDQTFLNALEDPTVLCTEALLSFIGTDASALYQFQNPGGEMIGQATVSGAICGSPGP
jgi:hypothetical protein